MRPLEMTVTGARGIIDGLGRDSVSVDFRKFHNGLVIVYGRNGTGKTTFLDNLHPYPVLASRSGALKSFFSLKDSRREISFEGPDGIERKVRFLIDGTGRGGIEAYFYENGKPLDASGKVTIYTGLINERFGSPQLFFSSFFTAQGAENVANLTGGDLKALFSELLGFDVYDNKYRPGAKGYADKVEGDIRVIEGKIEELKRHTDKRPEIGDKKLLKIKERDEKATELQNKQDELSKVDNEIGDLKVKIEVEKQNALKLDKLYEEKDAINTELDDAIERKDGKIEKVDHEIKEIQSRLERCEKIIENEKIIHQRVMRLQGLRGKEESLNKRRDEVDELSKKLAGMNETLSRHTIEWREKIAKQTRLVDAIDRELSARETSRENRVKNLREKIEGYKNQSSLIEEVPCKDHETYPDTCKLLGNARSAKVALDSLEKQLHELESGPDEEADELRSRYEKAKEELKTIEDDKPVVEGMDETEKEIESINYSAEKHKEVSAEIKKLQEGKWEALLSELDVTKRSKEDLEKQLAGRKEERDSINFEYQEKSASLNRKLAELQKQIDEITTGSTVKELEKKHSDMLMAYNNIQKEIGVIQETLSQIKSDIDYYDRQLDEIEQYEFELKEQREKHKKMQRDLSEWRFVEKACSKDGIPALELDAAAPELSEKGTQMLTDAYGSGWGISFLTQRKSADGKKLLEDFRIVVHTPKGEKPVNIMSGGEKVWVVRVISDAIAEWKNERRSEKFLYRILDEVDGALDELPDENGMSSRERYWKLVNATHKRLGLYFTFAVTHDRDVFESAQQKIEFNPEKGIVTHT